MLRGCKEKVYRTRASRGHLWAEMVLLPEGMAEQQAGITDSSRKRASFRQADRLKREEVAKARRFLLDATLRNKPTCPYADRKEPDGEGVDGDGGGPVDGDIGVLAWRCRGSAWQGQSGTGPSPKSGSPTKRGEATPAKAHGEGTTESKGSGGKVSGDHLRQAGASLETIRIQLAAHKGATAAHCEAHRAVDAAIGAIDLALTVR
jgi:hypothetical protein